MLSFKKFRVIALCVCLFSMDRMLNAESFNDDAIKSSMENSQLMLRAQQRNDEGGKESRKCKIKKLKLKDFEGAWVLNRQTLGGLGGVTRTGTPSEGSASIVDGQVVFDKHGNGIVNFASIAMYNGTPGDIINFTLPPGQASVTVTITDPVNGVGTFIFSDPVFNFFDTGDFLAIRSKSSRKVIEVRGHRTNIPPLDNDNVTHYVFERQYQ